MTISEVAAKTNNVKLILELVNVFTKVNMIIVRLFRIRRSHDKINESDNLTDLN